MMWSTCRKSEHSIQMFYLLDNSLLVKLFFQCIEGQTQAILVDKDCKVYKLPTFWTHWGL